MILKKVALLACGLMVCLLTQADGSEISGEYIEARSCDVYTGPCFANGEVGISGKEAIMAWKIETGGWDGVDLAGLGVALVIKSNDTLGFGGSFYTNPTEVKAVLLMDELATAKQAAALRQFVLSSVTAFTPQIVAVKTVPLSLRTNHLSGKAEFKAGSIVRIETRKLSKKDCVCSNETVFYPPLTEVENSHPAYTTQMDFVGEGLDSKWKLVNRRSAFLATFSR